MVFLGLHEQGKSLAAIEDITGTQTGWKKYIRNDLYMNEVTSRFFSTTVPKRKLRLEANYKQKRSLTFLVTNEKKQKIWTNCTEKSKFK